MEETNSDLCEMIDAFLDFDKVLEEQTEKLPYSINLLDELHANENAHSRIFGKILSYKDEKRQKYFPLLDLFLKRLGSPFDGLEQKKPRITSEKYRIDLFVRDDDYAIIIENKINGAVDQNKQLSRYYEIISDKGVPEEAIHVLYLTSHGGSPSSDSFSQDERKKLGDRYREINYRHDIFPFLKEEVLPYVDKKGSSYVVKNLRTAFEQYVDYLAGRFHLREGEKEMRDALQKCLQEKLGIQDFFSVREKREKLSKMVDTLGELEDDFLYERLGDAQKSLRNQIKPYFRDVTHERRFGDHASRIRFFPQRWKEHFCLTVVFLDTLANVCLGIENTESNEYKGPPAQEYQPITKKLGESGKPKGASNHWLYIEYKAREREDVFNYFSDQQAIQDLANKILELAQDPELCELLQ